MWQKALLFLGGVVAAPILKPILRPVAREAVKGGILLTNYVHQVITEVREEVEDLAAEASHELHTTTKKTHEGRSKAS
jgi:hypothetical protein